MEYLLKITFFQFILKLAICRLDKQKLIFIASVWIFLCSYMHAQPNSENVFNGVNFIIEKFNSYDIVALGETHDKQEINNFYIQLINNDNFRAKVDFVVVEMGNHLYQQSLDDFVSGKPINKKELYKLWRNHTCSMLNNGDNTGLIRLLEAVRNANKDSKHKIRVLAADPPIDWEKIKCLQEYYAFMGKRDRFYTQIIQEYVLKANKKALLIMGNSHFNYQRSEYMIDNDLQNPITTIVKRNAKIYLLNIMTASSFPYGKLKDTNKGSIISTADPWLGDLEIGAPFYKEKVLKEQTNGIIYLGHGYLLTKEIITKFNDSAYQKELERRKNLGDCIE